MGICSLIVSISLLAEGTDPSLARTAEKTLQGQVAPELTGLRWPLDEALTLNSLRGGVVVLFFWNSAMQEFHLYLPDLLGIEERFRDQGVRFIGISVESEQSLRKAAERFQIPFALASDPMLATFPLYKIANIPTAIVIDPAGKVAWVDPPYAQFGFEETLAELTKKHGAELALRAKIDRALKARKENRAPEAIKTLKGILEKEASVHPSIGEAAVRGLVGIETEAMDLLRDAHRWLLAGKFFKGADILEDVAGRFAGTHAGLLAQNEMKKLRLNPKLQVEIAADKLLKQADSEIEKGKEQRAREALSKILKSYPETEAAEEAKVKLGMFAPTPK